MTSRTGRFSHSITAHIVEDRTKRDDQNVFRKHLIGSIGPCSKIKFDEILQLTESIQKQISIRAR